MSRGLLSEATTINIRIAENREIVSASDEVFRPEHQGEARTLIYESEVLSDYLDTIGDLLKASTLSFDTVTEPERQTAFRYEKSGERSIMLTRSHNGIQHLVAQPQ